MKKSIEKIKASRDLGNAARRYAELFDKFAADTDDETLLRHLALCGGEPRGRSHQLRPCIGADVMIAPAPLTPQHLAAIIRNMLLVRRGMELTPDVAAERANNIAQALADVLTTRDELRTACKIALANFARYGDGKGVQVELRTAIAKAQEVDAELVRDAV